MSYTMTALTVAICSSELYLHICGQNSQHTNLIYGKWVMGAKKSKNPTPFDKWNHSELADLFDTLLNSITIDCIDSCFGRGLYILLWFSKFRISNKYKKINYHNFIQLCVFLNLSLENYCEIFTKIVNWSHAFCIFCK